VEQKFESLCIDYPKPLPQILEEFSKLLIFTTKRFDPLMEIYVSVKHWDSAVYADLPSWVYYDTP